MFSGLVETLTPIVELQEEQGGVRVVLLKPTTFTDVELGDSISINGCCLTVVEDRDERLSFQAGEETLKRTTLGSRKVGDQVNCERSLAIGDRLGGHLVTGHIDGVGKLIERSDDADWSDMRFQCDLALSRQMASKGSVAIDGVSLTLVDVVDESFSVALIPHTLSHTTLGQLAVGDAVNLESDLLAKYVQRQLAGGPVEKSD